MNKPILGKEFSFFNIPLRLQRLQWRAVAQGHLEQSSLVPLVIVDESHGLGRSTHRRAAIADLVWGPRDYTGKPLPILRSPGALVVYMTGTPIHPNESETASRLGLLDVDAARIPHKPSYYDDVQNVTTRAILEATRDRAVIRRKEEITLNGEPDGLPIFPKRLVFPFQRWTASSVAVMGGEMLEAFARTGKDVLLAIDQYVASEASHGAKLFSKIRQVLRAARDWKEVKELVRESENRKREGDATPFGERVLQLARTLAESASGDERKRWKALSTALEAARIYEDQLKDERLENLTWKRGRDDNGREEKQMLFTKVGWIATAYDSLAKGAKRDASDPGEKTLGDLPEEDEETAGELTGLFNSADEMLEAAETAKQRAEDYLEPVRLDDTSKVRFSMLVALLEGIASLKLWPKPHRSTGDEDRFGWGVDDRDADRLRCALEQVGSEKTLKDPWVVHARYIHSVVDTAVRLQLRYGHQKGVPIVGIIIGDTPNSKRDEIKELFAKGALNIVCMSDAGAEGINLQRSNRIVLLDVPVSPGRIEQIAGRIHRLGSTRAAQVTLLLPPEYFGTRVFETLRKHASAVFKQATGRWPPARPASTADDDPYYVRQLAEYEARLLTAVAQTSGAIRGDANREAVEQMVRDALRGVEPDASAPVAKLLKSGFELIEEQRKRFRKGNVAKPGDLMPEVWDLVDALVKFGEAKSEIGTSTFHHPVRLIDDRAAPEQYGDLVTQEKPFKVLQLKGKHYWYGPGRFLPSDVPKESGFQWLGVIGNQAVSDLLKAWRLEGTALDEEQRWTPQVWTSTGLPRGKAVGVCGITNEFKADGTPAAARGERTLHVMLGFADLAAGTAIQWRPFFAKGSSVPRAKLDMDTWLPTLVPSLEERWAVRLIRMLTGLEAGCAILNATPEQERFALAARDSAVKEVPDEEEGTKSWRLHKENVKVWLDTNLPTWWEGGGKLGCRPEFFFMVFGQ